MVLAGPLYSSIGQSRAVLPSFTSAHECDQSGVILALCSGANVGLQVIHCWQLLHW